MGTPAQVQRVSLASRTHRLLLIEDDSQDALLICEMLKEAAGEQFPVKRCNQLASGLKELKASSCDAVILDLNLPDSEGLGTFVRLQAEFPHLPVIVLTGVRDTELALRAVSQGAQDYLTKGEISGSVLVRVLRYGIERKRAERHLRMLLEATPLGMIISNEEGKIKDLNAQALGMLGYQREELLGQDIDTTQHFAKDIELDPPGHLLGRGRCCACCLSRCIFFQAKGKLVCRRGAFGDAFCD